MSTAGKTSNLSDLLINIQLSREEFGLVFQAILEHSKDGFFVTNSVGTVVIVNRSTEEMFDFAAEDVLGRNVMDLVQEGYYYPSVFPLVMEKKRPVTIIQTTRNQKKILTTGVPVFDKEGIIRFVLVNDRDVYSLNRMLDNLETSDLVVGPSKHQICNAEITDNAMEGLVAHSPKMTKVFQTAVRAAKFDIPLIITGASGVGKNMIATLIHRLSDRSNGPFVEISCGAIPENLMESELFGYEKGAFTGASSKGKPGLIEGANKGTLFLDEIGEIPLLLQVKLLKFLEKMEFVRVGGVSPIPIDVRIIAATNRNLTGMVATGEFREDLYFRLNVVPIEIPSLSQRKEEILPLIDYFLKRFNEEFHTQKIVSKSVKEAMMVYSFPGNVRELENLMKRLVTMTEGDCIGLQHLPPTIRAAAGGHAYFKDPRTDFQDAVTTFEVQLLEEAVLRYGSQRKAAKMLGLSQATLSRKLKQKKTSMIVHQ